MSTLYSTHMIDAGGWPARPFLLWDSSLTYASETLAVKDLKLSQF